MSKYQERNLLWRLTTSWESVDELSPYIGLSVYDVCEGAYRKEENSKNIESNMQC